MEAGKDAHVAQSAEHFLGKEEVTGSILVMGSTPRILERQAAATAASQR